ncbi:hypothetical protein ACLOJK_023452 [Asimina triloba]
MGRVPCQGVQLGSVAPSPPFVYHRLPVPLLRPLLQPPIGGTRAFDPTSPCLQPLFCLPSSLPASSSASHRWIAYLLPPSPSPHRQPHLQFLTAPISKSPFFSSPTVHQCVCNLLPSPISSHSHLEICFLPSPRAPSPPISRSPFFPHPCRRSTPTSGLPFAPICCSYLIATSIYWLRSSIC